MKETEQITQAELARRAGVSPVAIVKAIKAGKIVKLKNGKLDWHACEKGYIAGRANKTKPIAMKTAKKIQSKSSQNPVKERITVKAVSTVHDRYNEARAKKEELAVQEKEFAFESVKDDYHKNIRKPVYKAVIQNNVKINSVLIAAPSKIAMKWPDPKQRDLLESMLTEEINLTRSHLADIEP